MVGAWSRRELIGAAALAALPRLARAVEKPWIERRVVALNWALAETLYAMRVRPLGAAEIPSYDMLIREPPTPQGVVDVGLQGEPNLELLHRLAPDLILVQSWQADLVDALAHCGPVESMSLFTGKGDPLANAEVATRRIGALLACRDRAEDLVRGTAAAFAACRAVLSPAARRPLYLVQTIDKGDLTVFTRGGLFQAVLDRLGLINAWAGESTLLWGGTRIGVDKLAADPDAALVMIAPAEAGVDDVLAGTALWSHLPAVRTGRVIHLPLVWGFGALPTAGRFARLLTAALTASHDD